jgi:(1->4)-alpha-D-glucan 1-alpha-D-glucosylmutase
MDNASDWAERLAEVVAREVSRRFCFPTATYRLQFEQGKLSFRAAADIVPYLDELGISHLYASPYFKTPPGSPNGYAIVDYTELNPELGSNDDYRAMVEALHAHGMGQLLDTVPNHMCAATPDNRWWNDVLENGPSSPYAAFFDIDWHPAKEELSNKVLLPILGDQYGEALESGRLKLEFRQGVFSLRHFTALLPIDPRTYRTILSRRLDRLKETVPADNEDLLELESVITATEHLPERTETEPGRVAERQREKDVIKTRLRRLVERSPAIAHFIDENVAELNGNPDDRHSFDALDELLDAQAYRLSHWKAAADEINYRRFFDINELAAVCMEDSRVFAESHRLVFEMLVRGDIDGLRIDHIDGLYDPMEYLRRLQAGYLEAFGKERYERGTEGTVPIFAGTDRALQQSGGRRWSAKMGLSPWTPAESGPPSPNNAEEADQRPPWSDVADVYLAKVTEMTCSDRTRLPLYVVVEKILGAEEPLPSQWLVAGTTGYDFLNGVNGLFVDPAGLTELTKTYGRFIDQRADFREVAYQSKLLILAAAMSSELYLLAQRLNRISERDRRSRDFTLNTLRVVLREIMAVFPVYRTYIGPRWISDRDRQVVYRAVAQAKRRHPAIDAAIFHFIRDVLLLESPPTLDEAVRQERELFVGRFQQVTSPVIAKGIEDTAFYRYFPLVSLNEVGGDPSRGPVSLEEFHRQNLARQAEWPRSLLATTTHDTKRSQDVRARIDVLSEVPNLWREAVNRWARWNHRFHREVDGQPAPSRNDEQLFYQTLVGMWPLERPVGEAFRQVVERMQAYMEKATHEAKVHTSWINPNAEYDEAVRQFVSAVLDDRPKNRFLQDFLELHEQIVDWGLYSAMSQTLLKLVSPGVPDIYQGQEIWDFSLVDPDNRRPVDFAMRRKMLKRLHRDVGRRERSLPALARELAVRPRDPRIKLFLTWRMLQFRRRHPEIFQAGHYTPLEAQGERANHVCAFAWRWDDSAASEKPVAIVVAPRWIARLTRSSGNSHPVPRPMGRDVWHDTRLIAGEFASAPLRDIFTGQIHRPGDSPWWLGDILSDFPVALLTNLDNAE